MLRFLECRQGEAGFLGKSLDLFAGLYPLPQLEGGNCLGDGLLQIPQIGELQDREVEIRHQLLRFIQYNSVRRARIALQESSGAGGLGRRSDTFLPFPGRFSLGLTLPDEVG